MTDRAAHEPIGAPLRLGKPLPAIRIRRHAVLRIGVETILTATVTLACAAWVLRLWRANLTVPLRYGPVDDTKFYLMLVQGIIDHGTYLANSSLGAPFGQRLYDYPQGADNLNLLIIGVLALFSSNSAVVVNLFLLSTFALVSATSHLVLRSLGVSAAVAGVISVLYALLPYHFFRGESHLLLSAYYSVPLTAYLFLALLGGQKLFSRRARARTLATVGLCVIIGSDNLYYATFALIMIAGATVIALVARNGDQVRGGLLVLVAIAGTLAVNLAPSLIYRAEHGVNRAVERTVAADESSNEAFQLRLANLILPAPNSRIAPLRTLTARYDNAIAPGYCEACYASVGTVGVVGFGWLALAGLGTLIRAGWATRRRRLAHASAGVALAFVFGSVGGLGALLELVVTPDIRAWNRISVVIAFFALLGSALLLDSLVVSVRRRPHGGPIAGVLLTAVLAIGVLDQTSDAFIPPYAATAQLWRSDAAFVGQIEAWLPRGASVFQLPYVPFPEGYPQTPIGGALATYATKYEPLRGYLHSSALRWSYGAMKGRPADWSSQLAGQPLSVVVPAVTAVGFDGIWVDPAGFESSKASRVRSALTALLGVKPLVSQERDLWFFDLRPYRARLKRSHPAVQLRLLREQALHPARSGCVADAPAPAAALPFERGFGLAGSVVAGLTGPPCPR